MNVRYLRARLARLAQSMPAPPPALLDEPIDDAMVARLQQVAEARRESEEHPTAIDVKAELAAAGEEVR
jgi:predicted transcriptional regulator